MHTECQLVDAMQRDDAAHQSTPRDSFHFWPRYCHANFSLLLLSFSQNSEYSWFRHYKENGSVIDAVIDFAVEQQISIFPNHSLYISVATNQTLGDYSCQARANSQPQVISSFGNA